MEVKNGLVVGVRKRVVVVSELGVVVGKVLVVEGSEQVGEVNGLEVVVRRRQMVVVVVVRRRQVVVVESGLVVVVRGRQMAVVVAEEMIVPC